MTPITDNWYSDWLPKINNNGHILWEGYDGSDWEIFVYDGTRITQITRNSYTDYATSINDKGYVAWRGYDGSDWEIFLALPSFLVSGLGSYPSDGGWIEAFATDYVHPNWYRVGWAQYNTRNGEARPAAGDVDGDGNDEIIIGLGPVEGDPSIPGGWFEVLDDNGTHLAWGRIEWSAYNSSNGESWPACGDVDGDGVDEIIVGLGSGGGSWLEIFDYIGGKFTHKAWKKGAWDAYRNVDGQVHPACGDVDEDGKDEIVLGFGSAGAGWFEVFDDSSAGYVRLAWSQVNWTAYNNSQGETWPAIRR